MCHLDIAPRNLLYLADGSVCLLDWATAGFYPRFFEVCVLTYWAIFAPTALAPVHEAGDRCGKDFQIHEQVKDYLEDAGFEDIV